MFHSAARRAPRANGYARQADSGFVDGITSSLTWIPREIAVAGACG